MPRQVTFHASEVSAVYTVDRLERQLAKELFYQPEDYCRFRVEYRMMKENQLHMERMQRFNEMSKEARYELQVQQQVKFMMNVSNVTALSTSAQLTPAPIRSISPMRQPQRSQGFATMA